MKKWRIYLSVYWGLVFIPGFLYGQNNKSQELNELLNEGRHFESKKLYRKICNELNPDVDLFYKFQMARFMGKNDSAAIYMEQMLTDYPYMFGDDTMFAYALLFDVYAINLKNYEKSLYTYKRMVQHLKENPYNLNEKELILWQKGNETRVDYLKQLINQSPIKMKRTRKNDFVKLEGDDRLWVEIKVNAISQKTYFDTGCNFYYVMNRKEATRLGIKCTLAEMSKGMINDTEMLIKQVTVDSVEIGNVTIYNIPTTIFEHDVTTFVPDSIETREEALIQVDSMYANVTSSVIGLPIMQLIGKFLIDYEQQTVSFPIINQHQNYSIEPNMYLYNAYLHMCLKFNGDDFVGTLDTGLSDYIKIDTLFYEKNENSITATQVVEGKPYFIMMAHKLWNNIPYKIADDPIIRFNGNQMLLPTKDAVRIYPLSTIWHGKYFDGVIGYVFFKRIGKKVLLDLDNMRLEAIE